MGLWALGAWGLMGLWALGAWGLRGLWASGAGGLGAWGLKGLGLVTWEPKCLEPKEPGVLGAYRPRSLET